MALGHDLSLWGRTSIQDSVFQIFLHFNIEEECLWDIPTEKKNFNRIAELESLSLQQIWTLKLVSIFSDFATKEFSTFKLQLSSGQSIKVGL